MVKDSSWTSDRQLCCSDLLGILLFLCEGYTRFLTGMEAKWRLFLLLLLPLTKCEVTIVKTIRRGPDVTEICVNNTQNPIAMIVCKIKTERNRTECNLQYEPIEGFVQTCDSRFSLKTENQTVFLHLMNLTPVDSGNHTCECSNPEGTDIYHLNITVEEDGDESISTQIPIPGILIGAAVFIIITAVTIWCVCRRIHQGVCSRSATSGSSACENPGNLDEDDPADPDDPYTALQQPDSDLDQSVSNSAGRETDASCKLYANV
ncbi:uncharacterized protein LOC117499149 isoform X2 [Trematomus bernacchii]|uniref:uncharacterized protein LOC117499149 isoform X2 n=1 Tax=Trematomus bernacchii TaxID=40690 RepID=UPI001469F4AC|nr:uncharacterized protein LOC117499149 isoform X2 [Trematomus bernacchii]